jgi:hypothetical protein
MLLTLPALLLSLVGRGECSALRTVEVRAREASNMLRSAASKVMLVGRATVFRVALGMVLAVSMVGVILVAQQPAQAHDHRAPKTVLMKGKQELQTGRKVEEYRWAYPSRNGNGCFVDEATFPFSFPREVPTVAAGSELKVRIHKSHKPEPFYMAEVDQEGASRGAVSVRLRPVFQGGERLAWDAIFTMDRPDTDYRLVTKGRWRDRDDCLGERKLQFAHWSFHVKTGGGS